MAEAGPLFPERWSVAPAQVFSGCDDGARSSKVRQEREESRKGAAGRIRHGEMGLVVCDKWEAYAGGGELTATSRKAGG